MEYLNFLNIIKEEFPLLYLKTNKNLTSKNTPVRENSLIRKKKFTTDGYFHEQSALIQYQPEIKSLANLVERLNALGIPPVFIFYTDFSWIVFQSMNDILAESLGNFMFLPEFWAWHVDPKENQAGWAPHRDKAGRKGLFDDNSPKSLTCWVPLTEANPLNGCIYVVPKQHDLKYGVENVEGAEIDLPSIRALPAKPGDVIIWDATVFHWGAQSSEFAEKPRLSMALEVQSNKAPPINPPLIAPNELIEDSVRLKLIGKQMLQYKHWHKLTDEQEQSALHLINYGTLR
ncbi:phytanoyl-CoA dioxygenase family protein [Methylophilaceae bacterium]|nr:phytanoyl-CoA dioxygenase family protein [Methylophilaceae bacterium]